MSEELSNLAIVEELGTQLGAAFRRREAGRVHGPALRAAALALAAAIGAGAVLATQLGGGATSQAQAAARVLKAAAARVEAHPQRVPRPDQFLFVRWRYVYLTPVRTHASTPLPIGGLAAPKARVIETQWGSWSATRVGETSARVLAVTFPTAAARALWVRLGRPSLGAVPPGIQKMTPSDQIPVGRATLTIPQLLAFPADARMIAARLFSGETAANVISDIPNIEAFPIRPRLRAAIYRALTLVPGIVLVGPARTLTGHSGVAIGTADGVVRSDLIIDPRTGGLLGSRTVVLDPRVTGLAAGTVYSQQTLVQRAITDTPGPPRGRVQKP